MYVARTATFEAVADNRDIPILMCAAQVHVQLFVELSNLFLRLPLRCNVVGDLRKAGSVLPTERAASSGDSKGFSGNGFDSGMGTLCGVEGADRRHALVRRLRSVERLAEAFWICRGHRFGGCSQSYCRVQVGSRPQGGGLI